MVKRGLMMLLWGVLVLAGFSVTVMLLWNYVVVSVFAIASITIWQALGMLVLSRILFGSFGGFGRRGMHGNMFGRGKHPFQEKWMKMTAEERKEFINKRRKFGFGRPFGGEHFFDDGRFGMPGENDFENKNKEPKNENE